MKKVTIEKGMVFYYNQEKQKKEVIGIPQVVENKIIGILNPEEGIVYRIIEIQGEKFIL